MFTGINRRAAGENAERGHGGTQVDNGNDHFLALPVELLLDQRISALKGIGFNVDNPGFQAGNFKHIFPDIHVLFPTSRQEHFYFVRVRFGRPLNLKIQGHFIQRIRNVLICFEADLVFHLELVKATVHFDDLGDDRRTGHRDSSLFDAGAGLGRHPLEHFAHSFDVGDIFLDYRISRQRLYGIALDPITTAMFRQLEQLH